MQWLQTRPPQLPYHPCFQPNGFSTEGRFSVKVLQSLYNSYNLQHRWQLNGIFTVNRETLNHRLPLLNLIAYAPTILMNFVSQAPGVFTQTVGKLGESRAIFFLPAGYVFAIWGMIYLGLGAYVLYQGRPPPTGEPHHRQDKRMVHPQQCRKYCLAFLIPRQPNGDQHACHAGYPRLPDHNLPSFRDLAWWGKQPRRLAGAYVLQHLLRLDHRSDGGKHRGGAL